MSVGDSRAKLRTVMELKVEVEAAVHQRARRLNSALAVAQRTEQGFHTALENIKSIGDRVSAFKCDKFDTASLKLELQDLKVEINSAFSLHSNHTIDVCCFLRVLLFEVQVLYFT